MIAAIASTACSKDAAPTSARPETRLADAPKPKGLPAGQVPTEGFAVELVSHFALEQNPFGWVQTLLNRLGFRRNLLYEMLKNESAREDSHPARRHPVQALLTPLALLPVLPLSAALWVVELLLRRGGTVEVCARRRPERVAVLAKG